MPALAKSTVTLPNSGTWGVGLGVEYVPFQGLFSVVSSSTRSAAAATATYSSVGELVDVNGYAASVVKRIHAIDAGPRAATFDDPKAALDWLNAT